MALRSAQNSHLAQFNFARAHFPVEDTRMQAFVCALDQINGLADRSPGFLWRLKTEAGHSIDIRPFKDELKLVTLSLWRDLESLRTFVYKGAHAEFLQRRHEWFDPPSEPYLVLWWRPFVGVPSVEEGIERLDHLARHGPSAYAFDFAVPFDRDGTRYRPMADRPKKAPPSTSCKESLL